METKKEYTNGEVVVTWEAHKCTHSGRCTRGLPLVFQPRQRPWINMEAADTEDIIEQVKQCPSGALGYYMKNQTPDKTSQ